MKNLFDAGRADEVKARIARLQPNTKRLWGTMNAAQAVAHCSVSMEMAVGQRNPPRMFLGRILGRIIKPLALGNDKPLRRNTPTSPELIIQGEQNLATERDRLCTLIDQCVAAGAAGCTTHPHIFFGRLTPEEWATLMYKHLDHHLRQFGV